MCIEPVIVGAENGLNQPHVTFNVKSPRNFPFVVETPFILAIEDYVDCVAGISMNYARFRDV